MRVLLGWARVKGPSPTVWRKAKGFPSCFGQGFFCVMRAGGQGLLRGQSQSVWEQAHQLLAGEGVLLWVKVSSQSGSSGRELRWSEEL